MVANLTAVRLCWFRNGSASSQRSDAKPLDNDTGQPSTWRGRSEQFLLKHTGCEAKRNPADGLVFLLDFSFYRTKWSLTMGGGRVGFEAPTLRKQRILRRSSAF
jgi:hypothetical protein